MHSCLSGGPFQRPGSLELPGQSARWGCAGGPLIGLAFDTYRSAPLACARSCCATRPLPRRHASIAACVHETLRLWPVSAQVSMRTPLADIDLPDGTCIPRGSM
eukprot:scaffold131699_cov75-Phaeocystis_antarctica.AAC.2